MPNVDVVVDVAMWEMDSIIMFLLPTLGIREIAPMLLSGKLPSTPELPYWI